MPKIMLKSGLKVYTLRLQKINGLKLQKFNFIKIGVTLEKAGNIVN